MENKKETEYKETEYGELIGRIGDEYYYLDGVFEYTDSFKGATGSVMRPVTPEEAEQRREDWDDGDEMWKQAVEAGNTTLGADEWHEMVMDVDGDEVIFDFSYCDTYGEDLLERLGEEYELVECRGGGRCFDYDMKWDELFNTKLWEMIRQYEPQKLAC